MLLEQTKLSKETKQLDFLKKESMSLLLSRVFMCFWFNPNEDFDFETPGYFWSLVGLRKR